FRGIDYYVYERARDFLARRHKVPGRGTRRVLLRGDLRRTRPAAPRTLTSARHAVCLTVKPVGEPDAGDRHVRFDERGWETGRCGMAQATAPILDSTEAAVRGGATIRRQSAVKQTCWRTWLGRPD